MTIKAIETRYAGHRFRSRLEARWAVFFDHLGITWEYEPQGYLIGPDGDLPYLPDFWLPCEGLWVEVKGAEEGVNYELLVNAVIPHWGLPGSHNMLVLGPIPRPGAPVAHSYLHFYKGDVFRSWHQFGPGMFAGPALDYRTPGEDMVGNDSVSWVGDGWVPRLPRGLCSHLPLSSPHAPSGAPWVQRSYAAARSARFEHGETP
jgi:hypothetical protein